MASTGGWRVNKFGGSSVADAAGYRRVRDIIFREHAAAPRDRIAVVVSAMGKPGPDQPKVTDQLLGLVALAVARSDAVADALGALRDRHAATLGELLAPAGDAGAAEARALTAALDTDVRDIGDLPVAVPRNTRLQQRKRCVATATAWIPHCR